VLVGEDHRPPVGIRAMDEDVLSHRDRRGGRARGWSRDRPIAGRERCQRTSSRECA
jgi:hypothetical protein